MSSASRSASTEVAATTRTLPCAPVAKSLSSACMRVIAPSTSRAWRSRAWPAAVGSIPRRPRTGNGAPISASIAAMRLLTADATIASRSAARAMLRSSQTAMNSRSVTGSKVRAMPEGNAGGSKIPLMTPQGMATVPPCRSINP